MLCVVCCVSEARGVWLRVRRKSWDRLRSSFLAPISENLLLFRRSHNTDTGSGSFPGGKPAETLKGDLTWKSGRTPASSPLVVNLLELGFMLENEPLSSVLLAISVFPLKPSFSLRKDAFSELLPPPLDALLGPVEEPNCPPVHGFPPRHGCHGSVVPSFKVKPCNFKIAF